MNKIPQTARHTRSVAPRPFQAQFIHLPHSVSQFINVVWNQADHSKEQIKSCHGRQNIRPPLLLGGCNNRHRGQQGEGCCITKINRRREWILHQATDRSHGNQNHYLLALQLS